MNWLPMVVAGGTVGGGVALLVGELLRPQPALAAALRRSDPALAFQQPSSGQNGRWQRWLRRLAHLPGVRIPAQDLALLGTGQERFMAQKAALAVLGLFSPVLMSVPWIISGIGVPLYLPAVCGLAFAAVLWIIPDLAVRDKASRARQEFAHALAAYLELVALRRAADAGATEALEKAAAVGHGWPFVYLQGALRRARMEKIPPWQALNDLATEYELPVITDVADIMQGSAQDGVAIYTALRSRASSLTSELLAAQAAEAHAASERMTAPGALLAVLVMVLMAFPAVIRMLTI